MLDRPSSRGHCQAERAHKAVSQGMMGGGRGGGGGGERRWGEEGGGAE